MKTFAIACVLLSTFLCTPSLAEDKKPQNNIEYQKDCQSFDDETLGGSSLASAVAALGTTEYAGAVMGEYSVVMERSVHRVDA